VNWNRLRVGQKISIPETASKGLDPSLRTHDSSVRIFSLKYAEARRVASALKELAPATSVDVDERTNAVIVRGRKETVTAAAEIIHGLDVPRP
jgi:type II secretory pathway component GspD/PulD (secretin)